MTPERYKQAGHLYHAALELEPDERAAFLESACEGDEELRREVESLIAAHDKVGDYFASPAIEVAARMVSQDQPPSLVDERLGHYRVLSRIGAGGMGEVFLGEDTRLGRKVALKLLPKEFTEDAERVKRFEREARAASRLNHPNIITVHEIGRSNSTHFIATEFIDGETLRQNMAGRAVKLIQALDIAAQVASALAAAHEAGIVHRDIKPENIMLRRDRIVKVLDFGLAKLTLRQAAPVDTKAPTESMLKTDPGIVMGTAQYMSPEQARGGEVDARTDIWSLGVVLYEMVTGRAPFRGDTPSHVIVSILESEPPPMARYAEAPAELERIITKVLRKEREERYQTASDLAIDLKSLKQEIEVEARLKRSLEPDTDSGRITTKSGGQAAETTGDVATARTTSSAEYLIGEIKRYKRGVAIAAAVLIAVAAFAYYFYPTSGGEAIDSVAVLPFVNVSGDPGTEYLSDGISDSVINSLLRLPRLRVISLNSVLRYKGRQIDPQEIGRELKVKAVVMGRMTQHGDGLAISTELVDVRDNSRLWGGQYDRKQSDILGVHEEIAGEIAEKLRLRLSGTEKQQLTRHYTRSTDAYHAYLRGRYLLDKRTVPTTEKSIEYFEQAIKLDPSYAPAYADLAHAYYSLGSLGARSLNEVLPKAREAVARALEIDDTLAEAHTALGQIKLSDWDWPGSERAYKRAIELNPNSGYVHTRYSQYLRAMGRFDEAIASSRRAVELEPVSVVFNRDVAINLYYARRYDEVIEQCQKTLELDPNMSTVYGWLARAYEEKGLYEQAIEAQLKGIVWLRLSPKEAESLREAFAASGWKDFWRKVFDLQRERAKQEYVSTYLFVEIYARLGEKDQALAWLEKAYEEHSIHLAFFHADPVLDDLRSDPRYTELLRKMNLAP